MNWISLILQFLSLRKSMQESRAMIEALQNALERAKRFLMGFLGIFFAAVLLFSGFLVAVIELGLQIDRDGHLSYSGLMVSATILFALGLILALLSLLLARSHRGAVEPEPRQESREDKIRELVEEFLVVFLTQLATRKDQGKGGEQGPGKSD
jgi:putative copper export protein